MNTIREKIKQNFDEANKKKEEIWALLKWLKTNHYLPQTEDKLQSITYEYLTKLNNER